MSNIYTNTSIKIGKPKKIPSTKLLLARRIEVPAFARCNWGKVSRTFPLLIPKRKGNRFL